MHTFFSLFAIKIGTKLAKENVKIACIYFIAILILILYSSFSRNTKMVLQARKCFHCKKLQKILILTEVSTISNLEHPNVVKKLIPY